MDPIIAEILRARQPIRSGVFRRWQEYLRNTIQPQLDELDELKAPVPSEAERAKKGRAA